MPGGASGSPYTPVFAMISCIVLAFYLNANAVMKACVSLAAGIVVDYLNGSGKRDVKTL